MYKKIEILGEDSPFGFALKLAESANTASYKRIKSVPSTSDILNKDKQKIQGNQTKYHFNKTGNIHMHESLTEIPHNI